MRILQLIDSLETGGAERMAVNYANALAKRISFSGLAATRKEGVLKRVLEPDVSYIFAEKKSTFDLAAIFRLRSYCKKNRIDFVHAHGSSFFNAVLLKLTLPNIEIVWHDHNGERDTQPKSDNKVLRFCSRFFFGIIVVNQRLEKWVMEELHRPNVIYLPNFTVFHNEVPSTKLHGAGNKVLCLANLRYPKNHLLIVEAVAALKMDHSEWTFHFVGNDLNDDYSKALKLAIDKNGLADMVYIYGLKTDTQNIIFQADICMLASSYEGLPVAILEYGIGEKPVISTAVGQIPDIIEHGKSGLIVPSGDKVALSKALATMMADADLRKKMGISLRHTIIEKHSENSVVSKYLEWLKTKST